MKKSTIILALLSSSLAFSQVGFNTSDPKATVDIVAKNTTGRSTNVDGLLIPRVDRERAQNMIGVSVSTLIYVEDISTGAQAGIAQNIDKTGYYYYNGTAWIKLESANQNLNIYTSDGTLAENRTVTQDDKSLAFTANTVNAFSVDGKTFSVDAASNKVGIGTIAPTSELQVVGNEFRLGGSSTQAGTVANPLLRIHSNANADGLGGEIRFNEDDTNYGYYLRHNTGGGATYGLDGLAIGSANPGNHDYNPAKPGMFVAASQNIGFGTATPQTVFHVDAARDNNINTVPTAVQQANDFAITPAGTVGIGNLSPRGALDINKGETNNHGLVLPTNENVNNFTNPLGGSVIAGTIIYDSTNDCVRFYKKSGNWSKCVDGGTVSPETGSIVSLDCAGASNGGTLTSGVTASGVSSVISYTGGNGGNHNGQTVISSGVTGLTATLSAGNFNTGPGNLTYTITGIPNGTGIASFPINIGGQNCILTRNVATGAGTVESLNCAGATHIGTLVNAVPASGVSSVISYTGGNGGAYSAQTVNSNGVTGLTATLSAGNFNSGPGSLTYTITGTPNGSGAASFNINIGGKNCTLTRNVENVPAPDLSSNCTGLDLAYTQGLYYTTGTLDGKNMTVKYTGSSVSGYLNQAANECGISINGSSWVPNTTSSKINFIFGREVTNFKVTELAGHVGDNYKFILKNGGAPVSPVITVSSQGSCNSNFNISTSQNVVTVTNNNYSAAGTATIFNIGGVWFDEIEMITTGANPTYPGSVFKFCIGNAR